jgi:hypothetical protein
MHHVVFCVKALTLYYPRMRPQVIYAILLRILADARRWLSIPTLIRKKIVIILSFTRLTLALTLHWTETDVDCHAERRSPA